jgi:hypothetical protein
VDTARFMVNVNLLLCPSCKGGSCGNGKIVESIMTFSRRPRFSESTTGLCTEFYVERKFLAIIARPTWPIAKRHSQLTILSWHIIVYYLEYLSRQSVLFLCG